MATINTVKILETKYGTYSLHFTNPDGRRRRLTVGADFRIAQRMAVKFNDWLFEGKDPEIEMERLKYIEKSSAITLKELYPIFLQRFGRYQSKNRQSSYYYMFKNICRDEKLVNTPVRNITRNIVLEYVYRRMEKDHVSPATVNKESSFIKRMLTFAVEWEYLTESPLYGLKSLKEPEKRRVELKPEEAEQLINALPEPISQIVEFAIYSGFRKENILSLRIEQIKFHDLTETGEVDLTIKGGRTEKFPLGNHATELLKSVIGSRKKGYVFVNTKTSTRYTTITKTFDRAVHKLGLTVGNTKLRFHDLRHVFCTWLLKEGVSIDAIRELAGHRDRATTDRYATLNRLETGKFLSVLPTIKSSSLRIAGAM